MYQLCVLAKVCAAPASSASCNYTSYFDNPQFADYPVIFVSWVDARDYCSWAGRRLPSEAEWEMAARAADGRMIPWGQEDPICSLANFTTYGRTCVGDPARVGSYPAGAGPYGVLDMAGNVMEWVKDVYDPVYYRSSPQNDPPDSDKSDYRVVQGGSWYSDGKSLLVTNREFENSFNVYDTLGFRCARSAAP